MIRAAVENHIPIHFVYFTCGDAGSCDRYYEHSCAPDEALNFGALRMDEARRSRGSPWRAAARTSIFWACLTAAPARSGMTMWRPRTLTFPCCWPANMRLTKASLEPNLPYARHAVVEAAKRFIREFHPEVIYTGHPDERHVDHRTNNWFVVKALQELLREGAVRPDLTC